MYFGFSFDPARIAALEAELRRQRETARDWVYPMARLGYRDDGQLEFAGAERSFDVAGVGYLDWDEAERAADAAGASVAVGGPVPALPLSDTAAAQLFGALGVPAVYRRRLESKGYGDLLAHNARELLARDSRRVMVRTLAGPDGQRRVRAIVSDRYRCLGNHDLFFTVAEECQQDVNGAPRAQLWHARLSDDSFELAAVSPHISGAVRLDRPFDPGDGWMSRWAGLQNDPQNAAIVVRNSETGNGGLSVEMAVMRRVCANFSVHGDVVWRTHVGRRAEADGLVFSDDTRQAEDNVVWAKVRDAVRAVFDPARFAEVIAALNRHTQVELVQPERAVDAVCARYDLDDARRASILDSLLTSGDRSRYGLIQAVTGTAHAANAANVALASRVESLGGALVSMPDWEFALLVA